LVIIHEKLIERRDAHWGGTVCPGWGSVLQREARKGDGELTNTEIIYSALLRSDIALPELKTEEIETSCMVCGKVIKEGAKVRSVVSGNFTDYDTFMHKNGTHICKECGTCIKTRELRINNMLADKDKIYLFKKKDLEKYLLNLGKYIKDEFVIGLTRSFKKHNSFRCSVNYNTKKFYIREEDKEYHFDVDLAKNLYRQLWEMYLYFTKDEILTADYSMNRIKEFGLMEFHAFEEIFREHRGTHYFDLLVYMLDSEKRNKIVDERIKAEKAEKERIKREQKSGGQLSLL